MGLAAQEWGWVRVGTAQGPGMAQSECLGLKQVGHMEGRMIAQW